VLRLRDQDADTLTMLLEQDERRKDPYQFAQSKIWTLALSI